MLEIKKLKTYDLPKYPQGTYIEPSPRYRWNPAIMGSFMSTAMLALIMYPSCVRPVGVTGPPPMPPKMLTEQEARSFIKQVYNNNGIQMEEDVPYLLSSENGTTTLNLDGYNKQLKIGYEYLSAEDLESLTPEIVTNLEKNSGKADNTGTFIQTISEYYYYDSKDVAFEDIEKSVQSFITELKANGHL